MFKDLVSLKRSGNGWDIRIESQRIGSIASDGVGGYHAWHNGPGANGVRNPERNKGLMDNVYFTRTEAVAAILRFHLARSARSIDSRSVVSEV